MATDGSGAPDVFEAGDIVGLCPGGRHPNRSEYRAPVQRGPFIAEAQHVGTRCSARNTIHLKRSRLQVVT